MIILKKNRNYFAFTLGKSDIPVERSLIPYLSDEIILEDGVTFGQFFDIILKHHEEYSEFFASYLGGITLGDFVTEYNSLTKLRISEEIMDTICVCWGDVNLLRNEINNPIYIPAIPDFIGLNSKHMSDIYSLEYTPINELKKYPFRLKDNIVIYDAEKNQKILSLARNLTVFDVLISIFNEITFIGTPEEKRKSLENIREKLNKSLTNIKKESTSLNDFLKKLKIDPPKEE